MKYRLLITILWIVGILFPMHAVRRVNSSFKDTFDLIFATHTSHVVMHALLYAVLAYLLLNTFRQSMGLRARVGLTLISALCIAGLQEAVQVMTAGISFGHDEMFDLGVDALGALLGLMIALRRQPHDTLRSP